MLHCVQETFTNYDKEERELTRVYKEGIISSRVYLSRLTFIQAKYFGCY